jgi:SM-20-related protein
MEMTREKLEELRGLGLFLAPDFFSPDLCEALRHACDAASTEAASILVNGVATVDSSVRHAETSEILDRDLSARAGNRLGSILPTAAKHYGVKLTDYEAPQIVRYRAGRFYRPHIDNDGAESGTSRRKVSCVVFLNSSGRSTDNAGFVGGALAFFRLAEDPTEDNCKTLLYPTAGLLVAFKSSLYHEVLPVVAGERFTLVTWFR